MDKERDSFTFNVHDPRQYIYIPFRSLPTGPKFTYIYYMTSSPPAPLTPLAGIYKKPTIPGLLPLDLDPRLYFVDG